MKKQFRIFFALFLCTFSAWAQVTISPTNPTPDEEITITYDATQGQTALVGAEKVYIHTGVVTSGTDKTDWQYVVGNWGKDDGIGLMTKSGTDKWQIKIKPRDYYKAPAGTPMFRLAMVFRSADGTKEGKGTGGTDIFANINPGFYLRVLKPSTSTAFAKAGSSFTISAETPTTAEISVFVDNQLLKTVTDKTITQDVPVGNGGLKIVKITAKSGTNTVESTVTINVYSDQATKELPAGAEQGITYLSDTKVRLVLFAPAKQFVYLIGDFNDWKIQDSYLMSKTADGKHFWIEIDKLTPKKEYIFQYLVEGTIRIGDPYADKVADPFNDESINFLADEKTPYIVYPVDQLPKYPKDKTSEIATVLQTAQDSYQWKINNFQKPNKDNLIIYELLIRDFVDRHDYKTLIDSIQYFKRLGVNTIELMPIMEFENNNSWGYNVSYHLAVDKYYGHKDDLKRFIDVCHQNGIAVVLDMVINHVFGQSGLVRMWWDSEKNKPATNNPYVNPDATHPFNVGYDFNHESTATQYYIDRINTFWLKEYKFDGFRFDLAKGFTQKQSTSDATFRLYDESRVRIIKRMADVIWKTDPSAYVILELFSEDKEENDFSDYGMMMWGNMTGAYGNLVNGRSANIDRTIAAARGFKKQGIVSYMESHDEERLMFKAKTSGLNDGAAYDTKNVKIALDRNKAAAAFFFLTPGAKMTWQFQELGYDISIDQNGRVGRKPYTWNYYKDVDRLKLYKVYGELAKLRQMEAFTKGEFSWTPNEIVKTMRIKHSSMNVLAVGNFDMFVQSVRPQFPKSGKWYDYFTGKEINVTDAEFSRIDLAPGQFHIFTDVKLTTPEAGLVNFSPSAVTTTEQDWALAGIKMFPNPSKNEFFVEFENPSEETYICLFDLAGRKVREQKSSFENKVSIKTEGLSTGIYVLKLIEKDRQFAKTISVE